jgi:lipoprotein-anchoring transpeptidase ErfK/SrfK
MRGLPLLVAHRNGRGYGPRAGDSDASTLDGEIMRRTVIAASAIVVALGAVLGSGVFSVPAAMANFSAYDEPVTKPKKKKVEKKQVRQPSVQARKKQYQLQKKRTAEQTARRYQGRQLRCDSFFRCRWVPYRQGTRAAIAGVDRPTRKTVAWAAEKYSPGTIIVKTPERALYYVLPGGEALRYSVGVGKEGFQWSGNAKIVMKQEWPSWRPPKQMIEREAAKGHYIPEFMEGGPGNPLGARALYIGGTLFRIHGTNNAASIGGAVSSGCIRMMNADVIDLYNRVKVGSRVYVYQ